MHKRCPQGCTALVIAAQYGFVELVLYLSNHGCDPASVDNVGDSALHWAAYKGKNIRAPSSCQPKLKLYNRYLLLNYVRAYSTAVRW